MLAQLPAMEPVIDVVAVSEVDRLRPPRAQLLVHHSRWWGTWQLWVPCARPRTLGLYGGETTSNGCRSRSPERSSLGTGKVCAAMRRCASSKPRDLRGPRAPCASTRGKAPSTSRDAGHAPSPSISASRTRNPAVAPRSGRPQSRASMRRPTSSRCSPTGDDSPTPPRGERAGRRHSTGASSLLPPDPPPLIHERTGMLSPLDPPATVRCARCPAVHRDRDCHDRQEARAECPLWPTAHPAMVLFMPTLAAVRRPSAPCRDWACCAGRGAWLARSRRGSARRLQHRRGETLPENRDADGHGDRGI